MQAVLSTLLFTSLFAALFLLCVPLNDHELSPAALAIDKVKRTAGGRLTEGKNGKILDLLGKSAKDVLKTGILIGFGLALLAFLLTFKFIGAFSVIAATAFFILGILLTEKVLENEYRTWQNKLLEGVPTLVNFVPAFLEVEGVTPREALGYAVGFLSEPLKSEMAVVVDNIKRTGKVNEAMESLAQKANHPLFDAICFRLSAAWDARVTSDIFVDLADQVDDMNEMAITRATVAKTGYLALICVLGLVGMMLIYGYPGIKFLMMKMTGGFMGG